MRISIWLLSFLLVNIVQAQNQEHFKGVAPRLIGPAGMSGRVTAIAVHPSNENIIYVGAASGGVWKSENRGVAWKPIFDDQPNQSIGAIALNPQNPEEIWVGTGEGNPRNSHNSGKGIFKSTDGGKTWTFKGLENTKTIHRIIVDPLNPSTVFVGSLGSIWGPNTDRGVFKTTDNGNSWNKVLYVNETTGCGELRMHPNNPNILLAGMWDYQRKPYTFRSGGKGSGLYKSIDGGKTWQKLKGHGLPELPYGRIGLAYAPSNPEIIYALIESKEYAFYKSEDGGKEWKKQSNDSKIGNRPFYYAEIYVDPANENRIFSLWTNISESIDGGKNWTLTSSFKPYSGLHPDHHALYIHPNNPKFIINGNDGGLNISDDGGKSWYFVKNLPIGQFYHVSVDENMPYRVGGGMQDNGSWVGPGFIWEHGGIKNHHWEEVFFGDGFDVQFTDDPNTLFAMYQRGNVGRIDMKTGNMVPVVPTVPDSIELRFNWNAAIAKDPFNPKAIYFGSQFVHYSTDLGDSWEIISPDLTTNDKTKQQQDSSGGLTLDVTGAEDYTTIVSIAPHPQNEKEIWVGTDDGNLQVTTNRGESWTNVANRLPGFPENGWIPQIVHSKTNSKELFVVVNNYRQNDFKPYLYHSKDGGKTFRNIARNLPTFVLSVKPDTQEPNLIFCGTDEGLYYSLDGGDNWTQWTASFPSCPVSDLQIHEKADDLVIGTFGRSIWVLDNLSLLREMAKHPENEKDSLKIYKPADAYLATIRSIKALRFIADGTFVGENKPFGATFALWVAPEMYDKEKKIKFYIQNEKGDTVRYFTSKVDTGYITRSWNLKQNGPKLPNRVKKKKKKSDPGTFGYVAPGTYKVLVKYGQHQDSTEVTVLEDPRVDNLDWIRYKKDASRLEKLYMAAIEMYETLESMEKQLKYYDNRNTYWDESNKKGLDSMKHTVAEKMDSLKIQIAGVDPEEVKGYVRTDFTLNHKLQRANWYLEQHRYFNETGNVALINAKNKAEAVQNTLNELLGNEWKQLLERLQQEEKLPVAIPKVQFDE